MYVNPFVAGILATVLFETLLIVGFAIVFAYRNKKK